MANKAQILGTTELSYHIERVFKESNIFLIIVSPYLKINNRIKFILQQSILN